MVENIFNSCDKLSHCLIVIILQVQLHSAQHHGTTDVLTVSWNLDTSSADVTCMYTMYKSFKYFNDPEQDRHTGRWYLHWRRGQSCSHVAGVTAGIGSARTNNKHTYKCSIFFPVQWNKCCFGPHWLPFYGLKKLHKLYQCVLRHWTAQNILLGPLTRTFHILHHTKCTAPLASVHTKHTVLHKVTCLVCLMQHDFSLSHPGESPPGAGRWQREWKARGQSSQHTSSLSELHTKHTSSFSWDKSSYRNKLYCYEAHCKNNFKCQQLWWVLVVLLMLWHDCNCEWCCLTRFWSSSWQISQSQLTACGSKTLFWKYVKAHQYCEYCKNFWSDAAMPTDSIHSCIVWKRKICKSMATIDCLVTNIQQKKKNDLGLEQLEGE